VDITPRILEGRQVINSYTENGFSISGTEHTGAVIVLPEQVLAWDAADISTLRMDHFDALLAIEPRVELLLFGCGPRFAMIPPEIRIGLKKANIAIEGMDTGAACRTYNVLLGEDRRAGAALLPSGL